MKYEFEHQWGGEDTWYTKSKRWANKQKFPINNLALGIIEWLWNHWVDGKVQMTMADIDKQVKYMGEIWDEEDKEKPQTVIESTPSEVDGLDNIRIINRAFIPDPWDSDWNDVFINHKMWYKDESGIKTSN